MNWAIALTLAAWATTPAVAAEPKFAAPEIILDGSGYLYPSPVYEDVDDDGQRELLIGDLWGKLVVYENTGDADEPKWGKPNPLQAAGKDFKVPNW